MWLPSPWKHTGCIFPSPSLLQRSPFLFWCHGPMSRAQKKLCLAQTITYHSPTGCKEGKEASMFPRALVLFQPCIRLQKSCFSLKCPHTGEGFVPCQRAVPQCTLCDGLWSWVQSALEKLLIGVLRSPEVPDQRVMRNSCCS